MAVYQAGHYDACKRAMSSNSFNMRAAAIFRDCAAILRGQHANPFRVNAYLRAADTLESLSTDARDILNTEGTAGLIELPGIGRGLAAAIDEIARTGGLAQFNRLRGESAPAALFQSVPGVGPKLAQLIHDELQLDTLEALEIAAYDGRLASVRGIGPRRADAIRAGLAALLRRGRTTTERPSSEPSLDQLLDVDREYRRRSANNELPRIAPKRFNPQRAAWLPILHTDRNGWHFTALYSNSALAHQIGRTDDWVVIYFYDGEHQEGQRTVVTETKGPHKGQRVVRGRADIAHQRC